MGARLARAEAMAFAWHPMRDAELQMFDSPRRGKDHWAAAVHRYLAAKAALGRRGWTRSRHAITPEPAMPPIPPEMPPTPSPIDVPPVVDDPPGVPPPAPPHDPPTMPPSPNAAVKQPRQRR